MFLVPEEVRFFCVCAPSACKCVYGSEPLCHFTLLDVSPFQGTSLLPLLSLSECSPCCQTQLPSKGLTPSTNSFSILIFSSWLPGHMNTETKLIFHKIWRQAESQWAWDAGSRRSQKPCLLTGTSRYNKYFSAMRKLSVQMAHVIRRFIPQIQGQNMHSHSFEA